MDNRPDLLRSCAPGGDDVHGFAKGDISCDMWASHADLSKYSSDGASTLPSVFCVPTPELTLYDSNGCLIIRSPSNHSQLESKKLVDDAREPSANYSTYHVPHARYPPKRKLAMVSCARTVGGNAPPMDNDVEGELYTPTRCIDDALPSFSEADAEASISAFKVIPNLDVFESNQQRKPPQVPPTHRLLPLDYFKRFYVPVSFLWSSSDSETYVVRQKGSNAKFMAKVLLNSNANSGTWVTATTLSEAQVRESVISLVVDHPNLLKCNDFFFADMSDARCIQRQVVQCTAASRDGATLTTWQPGEPLPPSLQSSVTVMPRLFTHEQLGAPPPVINVKLPEQPPEKRENNERLPSIEGAPPQAVQSGSPDAKSNTSVSENTYTANERYTALSLQSRSSGEMTSSADAGSVFGRGRTRRFLSKLFHMCGTMNVAPREDSHSQTSLQSSECAPTRVAALRGQGMESASSTSDTETSGYASMLPADPVAAPCFLPSRNGAEIGLNSGRVVGILIYEMVAGTSLESTSKQRGPLSEQFAAHVMMCVFKALNYLHNFRDHLSLVHRNVQLRNIVIDECHRVVLCDYSNAVWLLRDGAWTVPPCLPSSNAAPPKHSQSPNECIRSMLILTGLARCAQAPHYVAPEMWIMYAAVRERAKAQKEAPQSPCPRRGASGDHYEGLTGTSRGHRQGNFHLMLPPRNECAEDVWATGVCLYSLLHAHYPFQTREQLMQESAGNKVPSNEIMQQVLSATFVPVSQSLSRNASHLLKALLTFEPSGRLSAVDALLHPLLQTEVGRLK